MGDAHILAQTENTHRLFLGRYGQKAISLVVVKFTTTPLLKVITFETTKTTKKVKPFHGFPKNSGHKNWAKPNLNGHNKSSWSFLKLRQP